MPAGGVIWRGAAARFGRRARVARRRRLARALSAMAAAALAVAVLAAGGLYLRLAQGPVALDGLADRLEAAANAGLAGARVDIGGAVLSLGDATDPRPGLRFTDVAVFGAEGEALLSAPAARVEIRPLDLLLGRLRPTRVSVAGATVRIARDAEGRFALGVGAAMAGGGAEPAALASPALSALAEIRFVGATLTYDDRLSGRVWTARDAVASLRRLGAGFAASARASLPEGPHGPVSVTVSAQVGADRGFTVRAAFDNLAPPELAAQFPDLAALRALDAPATGEAAATVDPAGDLEALSLDLRLGAGRVRLEGETAALGAARIALAFDAAADRFAFERIELESDLGRIAASGSARLSRGAGGAVAEAVAQLDIAALEIAAPALYDAPVAFDGGAATARVSLAPLEVEIAELFLRRGALTATARGRAAHGDAGWEGALAAEAGGLDVAELVALWPKPAAPGARLWVSENMAAGAIDRVALRAALRGGEPDLALNFAFRDAVGHYLRPMPPIVDASGWGELDLERFALTLAAGRVVVGEAGTADLSGSAFVLPSLAEPLPPADIAVRGRGPIAAILSALDAEPLGLVSKFGLDPLAVEGAAEARATLSVPLLKDLLLEDVGVAVAADLSDVGLTPPGLDLRLTGEALALEADIAGLRLSGPARLDGAPARIDWRERFAPEPDEARSVVDVSTTLSQAQMEAAGLETGGVVTGPVGVAATLRAFDGETRFAIDADLSDAALALDALGWRKPAGQPARARAEGRTNGATAIDSLSVEAPGLRAAGAARLSAGGGVERLSLARLTVGEGVDVSVEATVEGELIAATVSGARFDVGALSLDGGGGAGGGPRRVRFDLDRLEIGALGALSPVSGLVSLGADGAVDVELAGDLGGRAPAALVYAAPAAGPGRATLSSENAGALLREAGLFADGVGGALLADAEVDPAAGFAMRGTATITDITILDDPTIQRLVAEVEPERAAELADGAGIRFTRVSADFALDAERLRVSDGVAVGPSVGVTLEGDYHIEADRLGMRGVFSPAYQVNAALGGIPLLGPIITGGGGEGVFGVNFTVTGPSADPEITVNPLSALLPGPFRRLLRASDPEAIAEGKRRLEEMRRLRRMME